MTDCHYYARRQYTTAHFFYEKTLHSVFSKKISDLLQADNPLNHSKQNVKLPYQLYAMPACNYNLFVYISKKCDAHDFYFLPREHMREQSWES